MSGSIVKRQHFVWRRYLRSWCIKDDIITAYFKSRDSLVNTNLMNIGQSRYFYQMEVLSPSEIQFAKSFIDSCHNKDVAEYGYWMLSMYERFSEMYKMKDDKDIRSAYPDLDERLEDIQKNTFEHLQGKFEPLGEALLSCKSTRDLEDVISNKPYDALFYLTIQYFRTRTMKDRVSEGMSDRPEIANIAEKTNPLISFVMSLLFVYNAARRQDYTFILVNNDTNISFITGEQPVINTVAEEVDENGYSKDLEFYYPISPKLAYLVTFGKSCNKVENIVVNEEWVNFHNKLIWKYSEDQIYAQNESDIQIIQKNI